MPHKLKKFLKRNTEPLKDLDFMMLSRKYKELFQLKLSDDDRKQIIDRIEADTTFLSMNQLMDYSILIGIEEKVKGAKKVRKSNYGI